LNDDNIEHSLFISSSPKLDPLSLLTSLSSLLTLDQTQTLNNAGTKEPLDGKLSPPTLTSLRRSTLLHPLALPVVVVAVAVRISLPLLVAAALEAEAVEAMLRPLKRLLLLAEVTEEAEAEEEEEGTAAAVPTNPLLQLPDLNPQPLPLLKLTNQLQKRITTNPQPQQRKPLQ
jgi:hypothetical protein